MSHLQTYHTMTFLCGQEQFERANELVSDSDVPHHSNTQFVRYHCTCFSALFIIKPMSICNCALSIHSFTALFAGIVCFVESSSCVLCPVSTALEIWSQRQKDVCSDWQLCHADLLIDDTAAIYQYYFI